MRALDRSRVLTLIGVTYKEDAIRQKVPQETRRDVFCSITSVSAQEWFDAGRNGINPQWRATMFVHDYNGEQQAELGGERFGIYRTYLGRNEMIELYLERKAGV